MSATCNRAKRYCDRANECMQVFATSQTPGTGKVHLLIAEHYLLLAAMEKRTELGLISNRQPMVPIPKFDA
jgi:hypothetical protein